MVDSVAENLFGSNGELGAAGRPLFLHGKEGNIHGGKARWLRANYDAVTPAYDTASVESALETAEKVLELCRPSVVIGSSFGGAVLLSLVQRGLWSGPSIFLAQAGVMYGMEPSLPDELPAILVHGLLDDVVDIEGSRVLAASNGSELIEIDDNHRLSTIRGSGLLSDALASFGVRHLRRG